MLKVALQRVAKNYQQPKFPSTGEWILKKITSSYNQKLLSKNMEYTINTCINWMKKLLSEISLTKTVQMVLYSYKITENTK